MGPQCRLCYFYSMTKRPAPKKLEVKPRFKEVIRPPKQFFKQWRKHRGMTLEQAAPLANMTAGNLSAMERGAQGYTPDGLEALAQVYKTSPGWLLEVNPLEDRHGFLPIWDKADESQRETIIDLAQTVVKRRSI
jgi:transcriptional regulator with XRE-family HTH domain